MKKKYLIYFLTILGLVIFVWLYLDQIGHETNVTAGDSRFSQENNEQLVEGGDLQEKIEPDQIQDYLKELTDEEKKSRPAGWSDKKWLRFVYEHRTRLSENGSVKFYGKIIDQNDKPLQGVKIDAEILYHEPSMTAILKENTANREETIVITSEVDGRFSVIFSKGKSLTLRGFTKDGYQLEGRKYFVYDFGPRMSSPHNPDPSSPVVFRMLSN
jgi:hypothetical protein